MYLLMVCSIFQEANVKTHPNPFVSTTLIDTRRRLQAEVEPQAVSPINASLNRADLLSYGRCSQCSCPGFIGSGYTCTRGGCGHHYDEHG